MATKSIQNRTLLIRFLEWEVTAGIFLIISAILALIVANSPLNESYQLLLNLQIFKYLYDFPLHLPATLLLFVNDFLMAIFFLFVGLGIKNEFVQGELSTIKRGILPFVAAVFGMVVPALIFLLINKDNPENWRGWAIPSATDIAFAVGAIALLGNRISTSLKILLTAIAVIDDLGAILIIAFYYTSELHFIPLFIAGGGIAFLTALNLLGVKKILPYLIVGLGVWFAVHESGVHATITGVMVALTIPVRATKGERSPLIFLEKRLAVPVNYMILPLFGFLNAGVSLVGISLASFLNPLSLGLALGLFLGKQLGIFLSIYACIKLKIAHKPYATSFSQLYGMAIISGIGFTMSLFIGGLSFSSTWQEAGVRIGVLSGSLISLTGGYIFLRMVSPLHAIKHQAKPQHS